MYRSCDRPVFFEISIRSAVLHVTPLLHELILEAVRIGKLRARHNHERALRAKGSGPRGRPHAVAGAVEVYSVLSLQLRETDGTRLGWICAIPAHRDKAAMNRAQTPLARCRALQVLSGPPA